MTWDPMHPWGAERQHRQAMSQGYLAARQRAARRRGVALLLGALALGIILGILLGDRVVV